VEQRLEFLHGDLEALLAFLQSFILGLDAAEHLVKRIRKPAQFVPALAGGNAQRIVFFLTNGLGGLRKPQHRVGDDAPQPARKEHRQADRGDQDTHDYHAVKAEQLQESYAIVRPERKRINLFTLQSERLSV